MLGTKVPNITFPVCDIFEPSVFDGQLCYQVGDLKHSGQAVSEGKASGLMLLIDVNFEKFIEISAHDENDNKIERPINDVYFGQAKRSNQNLASIHIGTLAKYVGHGPGDYALTAIKQMAGTDNFLAWPEEMRDCAIEKYEECQMKEFYQSTHECSCSPFHLLPIKGNAFQVQIYLICMHSAHRGERLPKLKKKKEICL